MRFSSLTHAMAAIAAVSAIAAIPAMGQAGAPSAPQKPAATAATQPATPPAAQKPPADHQTQRSPVAEGASKQFDGIFSKALNEDGAASVPTAAPLPVAASAPTVDAAGKVERIDRNIVAAEAYDQTVMSAEALDEEALVRNILDQGVRIERLVKKHSTWDMGLDAYTGLGEIQRLRIRAEAFGLERDYAETLETEILKTIAQFRKLVSLRTKNQEANAVMDMQVKILELQRQLLEKEKVTTAAKDSYEYYEVKEVESLVKISESPDVYGDPTRWRVIYEANREKIIDPTKPVPKGTVLVIPRMPK